MVTRKLVIVLVAALVCLPVSLSAQPEPPGDVIVLRGGSVLDPVSGETHPGGAIVVRGERIEAVGPGIATPVGARVIDLTNYTILPGLIDAHTHVMLQPEDEVWPAPVVYKSAAFRTIQGQEIEYQEPR
jgi:imidazolonepropionase-like amidohydrolase